MEMDSGLFRRMADREHNRIPDFSRISSYININLFEGWMELNRNKLVSLSVLNMTRKGEPSATVLCFSLTGFVSYAGDKVGALLWRTFLSLSLLGYLRIRETGGVADMSKILHQFPVSVLSYCLRLRVHCWIIHMIFIQIPVKSCAKLSKITT